jgi:hypothetical protein
LRGFDVFFAAAGDAAIESVSIRPDLVDDPANYPSCPRKRHPESRAPPYDSWIRAFAGMTL